MVRDLGLDLDQASKFHADRSIYYRNGLQRKIRRAQDFVPVIEGCDVLEESENTVVREAHFKAAMGNPAKTVREVCKSYPKSKASIFFRHRCHVITNATHAG